MTLREKIEVMEAFERGEEIEFSVENQNVWDYSDNPAWNWRDCVYRIKPKPVFEWQWAYITNSLSRWHITNYMTEEEFKKWKCGANSSLEYKRMDFTKR